MPALNFKEQFALAVLEGRKTQTIRATRKHPIKVGDSLHLYTGMRTKQCLRLRVTKCTCVRPITINTVDLRLQIHLEGRLLDESQVNRLVRADGFKSDVGFRQFFFFTHGPLFHGQLIEWRPVA